MTHWMSLYQKHNHPYQNSIKDEAHCCLLYTSDAADERSSVDLGGRRIIKKKKRSGRLRDSLTIQQKK